MKHTSSKLFAPLKRIGLIGALLAASCAAVPAFAGVVVGVEIGVPPPVRIEVAPAAPIGYVWAPGYWDFFRGQYVWRRGHFVQGRPGYNWVPERWERHEDGHHFQEGHWDHDPHYHDGRREEHRDHDRR